VSLARQCTKYLDDAERRIELLVKVESGATTTKPLAWEEEER